MKTYNLFSILAILIFLLGCQEEELKTDFNVSGYLKSDGKPLVNASVDIDGLEQYKTSTNTDGYFIIENIPAGTYSLNTKMSSNNKSYIQRSYDIVLENNDIDFDSLILPNPVLIDTILLDSLTNIATIIWNKSKAEDFREYKLYSHTTSGLDESTGLLEHVTIDINDTSKSIQIENLTEKYFRVFVLNEYGQLGGSNIISISSVNKNIVLGGNFNSLEDLNYWSISGNIKIDSVFPYDGAGCLLLTSELDTLGMSKTEPEIDNVTLNEISIDLALEEDRDYTLSFWYRLKGFGCMIDQEPFYYYYYQDNEEKLGTIIYDYYWAGEWYGWINKVLDDTGWIYYSKTFNSDSDANAVFHITCRIEEVWIDKLEIKIVE